MNHAQLVALGRALRVLGEHGEHLSRDTPDAALHEIRADLTRALSQLEESISAPKPTTRCQEHPTGPVDDSARDLCLLCETRRRAAPKPAPQDEYSPPPVAKEVRVQSRYGIREERPQPQERWVPEMWNGQAWQLCGTPRRDRREAEQYIAAQRREAKAAPAYRVVHAFTDHVVVRTWGSTEAPSGRHRSVEQDF
ncbi:hypothetical protein BM536_037685 [Streptomyces phaeoluteigriseus]|uniref:Uncharacterized protein n=1 Tax=Streptomyces phaeoluteigriseus TaxID=114686 RepID=A0A1V6MHB6_9ACTN|nr:hypothetical protein [Streptomyces phaeoluteigriseus]OQD51850.1 hypothetical protein BM536_037685 [Streptomyces phaeoluteigriseus]